MTLKYFRGGELKRSCWDGIYSNNAIEEKCIFEMEEGNPKHHIFSLLIRWRKSLVVELVGNIKVRMNGVW